MKSFTHTANVVIFRIVIGLDRFMLISNLISDLITDLISDFGIASMLNYTIGS